MNRYAKALVQVLITALTALQAAITDHQITEQEYVTIALAGLGACLVYFVPNRPPSGEPADPRMSEQDPAAA